MKLLQCYVENFGKLHQFTLKFDAGLNAFCHENGWGKSTLITFIKSMFYGLSNSRSTDLDQNERKKYLPWQGGNFGGYLDFETKGKTYRVTRFFGKTNSADTFTLTDLATNKPSKDYNANLGETIFDLDAASFIRTLLIPQVDVETVTTTQINDRLINLIQGTNEQSHYETAVKILDDQRRALSNKSKTGQIEKTQTALLDNAMQMDRLRQQSAQVTTVQTQINSADEQIAALQKRQAAIQQQIGAQTVLQKLPTETKPHKAKLKLLGILSIVLCVPLVIVTVVWLLNFCGVVNWGNPWLLIMVDILLFIAWMWVTGATGLIFFRAYRPNPLSTSPQPNVDLTALQNELNQLQNQIEAQINAKMNAKVTYQNVQNSTDKLTELQRERQELNQTLQNLQGELSAVQAAQNFLTTAYENLNTKYLQPMQDGLQKYLHILTKQDFSQMTMDTDLSLSLPAYGQAYSTAYYSRGYQNLFDLCLRLALVDALFANREQPLLIMDDPFVNLDADKTAAAMQFLRTLAQDRQIIYFTCHDSRC